MDPAHQEAVARAKAIAARLAGMPAVVDYGGGSGAPVPAPAPSASYGTNGSGAGAGDVDSQANAALEAAFGGGGSSAPVSYAPATSSSNGSQTADLSRKRGVEDALASLIPGLGTTSSDANKRHRSDASSGDPNKVTKKLWIPSDRNPGYNYVGLLIGPGGSKQRELVAQSGGDVKISIRGRGSNSKDGAGTAGAPGGGVPGAPEEPLHVLLEGSAECVAKAEGLVRTLLEDSEAADKEKARQLGSLTGSGGVGGEGNEEGKTTAGLASGGYTPKPVAQILGLGGAGAAGGMAGSTPLSAYGPGGGGAAGAVGGEQVEEKIGVPNGVVGFIIGRGGESITSMQRKTGCRVQIQKEHEMAPGTAQRVITLTAATAEAIAQCRAIIETMVKERLQQTGALGTATTAAAAQPTVGPGSNAASQMLQLQKALAEGQAHVTVQVPDADVGLIIGKGGMQIRNIQEKSGANVQIPQAADANNPLVRTVNITHPNIEGANFAKQMIEEIMSTKASMNNGGGGMGGGGDVTIQVNCPDKDVGMIIGRGGCVIKQMQSSTRCRIQIPPTAPPGSPYRIISVIGPAAGCEQVKQMIERIIAEQSSQSVMAGVAYSGGSQYGQQQAAYGQQNYYGQQAVYGQQQAYGQQAAYGQTQKTDYSAEWAAYYAAQAAAQQGATGTATATAATATTSATAAAPAAVAGQQLAHDAYYEVFWQYAAYYGEEAARKHYGAWSPPVGTPNPNATASGTAAPSTASATAENPAPAPNAADSTASYQQSEIKDSSVRKVSNLPAWMNK